MNLITDRSEADVLLGNEKGKYSFTDMNRVEAAVKECVELAVKLDKSIDLIIKTDWSRSDLWADKSECERYLNNVKAVTHTVYIDLYLKSMERLTFSGANEIEKSLEKAYNRIVNAIADFKFSGEYYAGEV